MSKVKQFIKNYRIILLTALICLIVCIALTTIGNFYTIRNEIKTTNETQMEQIEKKVEELLSNRENLNSVYGNHTELVAETVGRFLRMENDDISNDAFLSKLAEYSGANNIIILNNSRSLINCVGDIRSIDYSNAYYDKLFAVSDGESAVVAEEGSENDYSSSVSCGNFYVVVQFKKEASKELTDELIWRLAYKAIGLYMMSDIAAVNKSDNSVIYSSIKDLTGKKLSPEKITDNKFNYGDETYYTTSRESDDVIIYALTAHSKVKSMTVTNTTTLLAVFVLFSLVLIAYIVCLREGETDPEDEYTFRGKNFLRSQTKRFKDIALLMTVASVLLFAVMTNLNNNRYDIEYLEKESTSYSEAMTVYSQMNSSTGSARVNRMYDYCRLADEFLAEHSDYCNKAGLKKIANALDISDLTIFDADGNTVCTSSSMDHINIYDDSESSLYELRYALMGKEGVEVEGDPEKMSEDDYIYAIPRRDAEGVADGVIAVITKNGVTNSANTVVQAGSGEIRDAQRSRDGTKMFTVDKNGKILTVGVISDDSEAVVREASMKDGYSGRTEIEGKEYIVSVEYMEEFDKYLYVALPATWLGMSLISRVAMALIMFILMAFIMWYDGLGSKYHFEKRENKIKDADDWERTELNWDELSIGAKMGRIMSVYVMVLSVIVVLTRILFVNGIISDEGIGYIVSGEWTKSFNGYAVLGNVCIACVTFSVLKLADYVIDKAETVSGDDGSTVCRLISSLCKYVGVVVAVFIILTNFGVDAATALASLGIAGFALSFGAQELVKDMISGMFILFEGKFKVGDMIDIDGDWYWIKSIGVRTTTLEAWGEVRVINNSQMTGMVNISNASSVVNVDIMIANEYDVNTVEEIVMQDLPKLKEKFNADVSTPTWKGVQSVTAAGTVVRMRTYCPPLSQGRVGRMMRKEIKRIFEENGIELANEALVVHTDTRPIK